MTEELDDEFAEFREELSFTYEPIALDTFLAIQTPPWQREALCVTPEGELVDIFFPITNTGHGYNHLVAPRKICLQCPVRYECLAFGLDETYGVWGGHSASQRRRIVNLMKKGSTLEAASQSIDIRSRDAR